jgi:nucleotide sugar dehydrogenase
MDLERPNGVWAMQNADSAEFAKIAETTYRDVNIGLANEFAVYASKKGIDMQEIIDASNSQPFSHIHSPGISVGGHCIPVYPKFYIWDNEESQIVKAARDRNLQMPLRAVSQIKSEIGELKNLKIGILGLTYRTGVKEAAFSGSFDLLRSLKAEGAIVFGMDPFFAEAEIVGFGFEGGIIMKELDGVIIHTSHDEFKNINFGEFKNLKFLYDGRRSHRQWQKSKNFKYLTF